MTTFDATFANLRSKLLTMGAIPTGSRELGFAHADSDWDYFLEWEFGRESQLRDLGFQVGHRLCYHDPGLIGLMSHPSARIDVLLVDNIEVRKDAMDAFKRISNLSNFMGKLDSTERKDVWSVIVRVHRSAREREKGRR